ASSSRTYIHYHHLTMPRENRDAPLRGAPRHMSRRGTLRRQVAPASVDTYTSPLGAAAVKSTPPPGACTASSAASWRWGLPGPPWAVRPPSSLSQMPLWGAMYTRRGASGSLRTASVLTAAPAARRVPPPSRPSGPPPPPARRHRPGGHGSGSGPPRGIGGDSSSAPPRPGPGPPAASAAVSVPPVPAGLRSYRPCHGTHASIVPEAS